MIGLLQRVRKAHVEVDDAIVAAIDTGLLVFVGVQRGDDARTTTRLAQRILGYRVFPDSAGRMNASVRDVDGSILLVPQFTLAADTRKGARPSFTPAAEPAEGEARFAALLTELQASGLTVASGIFGADMQVHLVNDGPVTFWLEVPVR